MARRGLNGASTRSMRNTMGPLHGIELLGHPPGWFSGAADGKQEQKDGEERGDHRRPLRQSSQRA